MIEQESGSCLNTFNLKVFALGFVITSSYYKPWFLSIVFIGWISTYLIHFIWQMNIELAPFLRNYIAEVCRCAELERKMRYIEHEITNDKIDIPEPRSQPEALHFSEMAMYEVIIIYLHLFLPGFVSGMVVGSAFIIFGFYLYIALSFTSYLTYLILLYFLALHLFAWSWVCLNVRPRIYVIL